MASLFGKDRHAVLARELTKTFETLRGRRSVSWPNGSLPTAISSEVNACCL